MSDNPIPTGSPLGRFLLVVNAASLAWRDDDEYPITRAELDITELDLLDAADIASITRSDRDALRELFTAAVAWRRMMHNTPRTEPTDKEIERRLLDAIDATTGGGAR